MSRTVPRPAVDEMPGATSPAVVVLAGGCFWGVQAVYQRTKGVLNAVSGYAGGDKASAKYGVVSGGKTGHAEAVQITYDPKEISFGQILQIFFSVVHDPTQVNRQGPDVGPQYRSAVFPLNEAQDRLVRAYITQLEREGAFPVAIATTVEEGKSFYPAEDYHQDYLVNNPRQPYIMFHDLPKLEAMKRSFPDLWREKPVLVKPPRRLGRLGQGSEAFYRGLPESD